MSRRYPPRRSGRVSPAYWPAPVRREHAEGTSDWEGRHEQARNRVGDRGQAFALQGGLINWFLGTTTARATGPITHGSGKFRGIKGTITVIPKRSLYIIRYHF